MFFSSEVTLPFETIKGVMKEYPAWNLMVNEGSEAIYHAKAMDGDPDYIDFVKRMYKNPKKMLFSSAEEGLIKLKEGRNVIHIIEGMLNGFFHSNPYYHQPLQVFGTEKSRIDALIFPLNSPVREVMKLATTRMFETSAVDYLLQKWEGEGPSQEAGMYMNIKGIQAPVSVPCPTKLSDNAIIMLYFYRPHKNGLKWRSPRSCLHNIDCCIWKCSVNFMLGADLLQDIRQVR